MINNGSPAEEDTEGIRYLEQTLVQIHLRKDSGQAFHTIKSLQTVFNMQTLIWFNTYCILGPSALLYAILKSLRGVSA